MSCQKIRQDLKKVFEKEYGKRKVKIIVSEDNVQGGIVE